MTSQACRGETPALCLSPPCTSNFRLTCKQPSKVTPQAHSKRGIEVSSHLQCFVPAGKRFAAALPLEMLDQKGVEVVLIGESDNLVR